MAKIRIERKVELFGSTITLSRNVDINTELERGKVYHPKAIKVLIKDLQSGVKNFDKLVTPKFTVYRIVSWFSCLFNRPPKRLRKRGLKK